MALDRRITIKIEAFGTRDENGQYVPGAVTEYPVWAERRAAGSSDQANGRWLRYGISAELRCALVQGTGTCRHCVGGNRGRIWADMGCGQHRPE